MRVKIPYFLLLVSLLITLPAIAEEGSADARRHMVRGVSAIEMAKSNAELSLAVDEFRRAVDLDPTLSAAWYNMGSVQAKLGQFEAAIQSYKHYLALVPNAEDAQKTQDEIIKLEFRQEQVAKSKARAGTWIASDGTPYQLKIDGNRMTLITVKNLDMVDEAIYVPFDGRVPILEAGHVSYHLEVNGSHLAGTWMHKAIKAKECTIPEERGEVTGELRDEEGIIVLRHARTKYRAVTQMGLLGLLPNSCREVEAVEKQEIEISFRGPLPRGSLGVIHGGRTLGGHISKSSLTKYEWIIPLQIPPEAVVANDTAAFAAGLRPGDEILSINGVEVKSLSAGDAIWRLRGEVGSEVNLTILHKDTKAPVPLRLKRIEVPD